jgi:ABC-type hemin transport system ATPase subunit
MNGGGVSGKLSVRRRIVEARDVVLSFGQTPALRGASMSAAAGEIVAVMGPSGSESRPCCTAWQGYSYPSPARSGMTVGGSTPWANRSAALCGETGSASSSSPVSSSLS